MRCALNTMSLVLWAVYSVVLTVLCFVVLWILRIAFFVLLSYILCLLVCDGKRILNLYNMLAHNARRITYDVLLVVVQLGTQNLLLCAMLALQHTIRVICAARLSCVFCSYVFVRTVVELRC
jgi:hypothetical protein